MGTSPSGAAEAAGRRRIAGRAALGSLLVALAVAVGAVASEQGATRLVLPGATGPSAGLFERDFPGVSLPTGDGHDGQQFYAIAAQPNHLDRAARWLDRPRYRAQRILLPALAWVLHPAGGGPGLVWALFAVGVAALFAGAYATGALAEDLGGNGAVALYYPLLPGAVISLGLGVADGLATALVLLCAVALRRGRPVLAGIAGLLGVLAKESVLLFLIGLWLWRRRRDTAVVVAVSAAGAGLWWLTLRALLPADPYRSREFDPGLGLWEAVRGWTQGDHLLGAALVGGTVFAAVVALRRHGLRSFSGWIVATQMASLLALHDNVIELPANVARALLPLSAVLLVALASPASRAASPAARPPEPEPVTRPRAAPA